MPQKECCKKLSDDIQKMNDLKGNITERIDSLGVSMVRLNSIAREYPHLTEEMNQRISIIDDDIDGLRKIQKSIDQIEDDLQNLYREQCRI